MNRTLTKYEGRYEIKVLQFFPPGTVIRMMMKFTYIKSISSFRGPTAVAQWLWYCATNGGDLGSTVVRVLRY
jgi:hypothetical protein